MDWPTWVHTRLISRPQLTAIVPVGSIYGAGSLTGTPENKPFIIVRFGVVTPELRDDGRAISTSEYMTVWAHDEPGDYLRIRQILAEAKLALEGSVPEAIACVWQGDSADFGDDKLGTITRNSEYRLVGGRQ